MSAFAICMVLAGTNLLLWSIAVELMRIRKLLERKYGEDRGDDDASGKR